MDDGDWGPGNDFRESQAGVRVLSVCGVRDRISAPLPSREVRQSTSQASRGVWFGCTALARLRTESFRGGDALLAAREI